MSQFPDVQPERYSAKAIERTAELGLLQGFLDDTFRPEDPITREQMAVLLDRQLFGWHELVERVDPAMVTILAPGGKLGSGTHIGNGTILTNHHVVSDENLKPFKTLQF